MTEGESKISRIETAENESEKRKKRFFSGLKNRLLALTAAGFITLGAGWGKDLLQYLEVEEKDAVVELVLGSEVTKDSLEKFKDRVETEEPDFARVAEEHRKALEIQLKNLEDENARHDIDDSDHQKQDSMAIMAEQESSESGYYSPFNVSHNIDTDHKLISQLKADTDFLKNNHEFFNANFDDIFWGAILLIDSKDSRDALVNFIKPPIITFRSHAPYNVPRRADTTSSLIDSLWQPGIVLYPQAFAGLDKRIDSNTYTNILIHEFIHAILAGSGDGKKIDRKMMGNDLAEVLDEGMVQGITYKLVRHLNRREPGLKPIYKETDGYDTYLVIAELVESIARTHSNSDFLVEWQLGIIDYKTMLENLRMALDGLGLRDNVYESVADFRFGNDKNKASEKFLNGLLAELKLANKVELSDEFIRSIIDRNNARH